MTVRERIMLCRLIEKIDKNRSYSEKLGISNESRFKGKKYNKPEYKRKEK